jgi:hypothetical protein
VAEGSYNPDRVLSARGLNTVLFTDPYAKLCYMAELVAAARNSVAYIDLDTMFSAYFQAGLIRAAAKDGDGGSNNSKSVDIYLPVEGQFMPLFKEVLAGVRGHSLVVFDSVNSFYMMYYDSYFRRGQKQQGERRAGGNINHLLSVLLMLLVRQGVSEGVPVVATSMLRYRSSSGGGGVWRQSPASRRLLQSKSTTRTSVDLVGGEIVQRVLAHDTMEQGAVLSYPVTALG